MSASFTLVELSFLVFIQSAFGLPESNDGHILNKSLVAFSSQHETVCKSYHEIDTLLKQRTNLELEGTKLLKELYRMKKKIEELYQCGRTKDHPMTFKTQKFSESSNEADKKEHHGDDNGDDDNGDDDEGEEDDAKDGSHTDQDESIFIQISVVSRRDVIIVCIVVPILGLPLLFIIFLVLSKFRCEEYAFNFNPIQRFIQSICQMKLDSDLLVHFFELLAVHKKVS